jgi:hypothetical protein
MPIEDLNDSRIRMELMDWREKVARKSGYREADNRLSATSAMLTWAVERGQVSANHLKGFKRLYHADRSEIIWLEEHVTAFMKVASLEMQTRPHPRSAHRPTPGLASLNRACRDLVRRFRNAAE